MRVTIGASSNSHKSTQSATKHPASVKTRAKAPAPGDATCISADAHQHHGLSGSCQVHDLLHGLTANFCPAEHGTGGKLAQHGAHGKSQPAKKAGESGNSGGKSQAEADKTEQTARVLDQYSKFTDAGNNVTSRKQYQKIASGKENSDFASYLKKQNPGWSKQRIDGQVKKLQSASQTVLGDKKMYNFFDTAANGGKPDGCISGADLVAGRLKNDISANRPTLSVDQTVALHKQNPVLGNQAITSRYYHEGQALNKMLGGDKKHFNATWPAFASIASNSAGAYIRSDGIPFNNSVSNSLAAGNRKVFQDIAPHFDSYIKTFSKNPHADFGKWLKSQSFKDQNGKDEPYLRQSFEFLNKARTATRPDKKQQYLLASNALAGYHEQQRLNPQIGAATSPGTHSEIERDILKAVANENPHFFLPTGKGSGNLQSIDVSKKLHLPGGVPPGLQHITDPQVRNVLRTVLQNPKADVSSGQAIVNNTGTSNWSNLPARMRSILGLMVAGQNDPRMGENVLKYNPPPSLTPLTHIDAFLDTRLQNLKDFASTEWQGLKNVGHDVSSGASTVWHDATSAGGTVVHDVASAGSTALHYANPANWFG